MAGCGFGDKEHKGFFFGVGSTNSDFVLELIVKAVREMEGCTIGNKPKRFLLS